MIQPSVLGSFDSKTNYAVILERCTPYSKLIFLLFLKSVQYVYQWFSTFLVLQSFYTVPHVVIPNHNIMIANSQL